MPRSKVASLLSLATLLTVPAFAQNANPARPGTLNYVEGSASIDGRALTSRSVGNTELEAGSMLATANGKAEVLLTPGVYLRVGENSTIRMVSPNLTHTEVEVQRGRAEVEADQIHPQNEILIDVQGGQARVVNGGLYEFDADRGTIRVFDGKAAVFPGSHADNSAKPVEVKGGRELAMNGPTAKTVKFDKNATDDLYNWSSLRSDYLGQANEGIAERYAGASGFRSGWFWDNSLYGYTWLPGDGMFFSPFGYGFYSPYYIYGGGPVYGYYGGGYYGGGYYGGGYYGGGYYGGYPRGGYNYGRGGSLGNHGGYGGGVHPGGTPGGGFRGGVGGGAGGGGFHGGGGAGGSHGGGGHR